MAMRQMEPTKVKVDGMNFFISPFAAFKAANLTGELAATLAPLLGALSPLVGTSEEESEEGGLMDIDAGKAAEAIGGCSAINGDKLETLMKKLLLGGHVVVELEKEDGTIEPERLTLDIANEVFCGNIQNMFVLCFHVIKLNFNGFFKKFAGLFGKQKPAEGEEETKTQREIL